MAWRADRARGPRSRRRRGLTAAGTDRPRPAHDRGAGRCGVHPRVHRGRGRPSGDHGRTRGVRRLRFSRRHLDFAGVRDAADRLSTYTAAFIGEIVRGGILAVGRGPDRSRGGTRAVAAAQSPRLVVLPQALRVIVPPTTTQFTEPGQELVSRRGHRLSRSDLDHQYHVQSDRPGHRSHRRRDGGLSRHRVWSFRSPRTSTTGEQRVGRDAPAR